MTGQDVLSMLGAIALFLFGMTTMTDGLEKLSSGRLEQILERLTDSVWKGVLLGALVTGVIQSSAATTVMCVGFVNAGIMKLHQTVGIIMGANIGTTVTAQLLALGDISSGNFLLSFLKPAVLGPLLAAIGIVLYMFTKGAKTRMAGQIVLGLGVLFIGMKTMESAVSGLKDVPEFGALMIRFSNPILGILMGALVTALLQSSSASMGILQALSSTGIVSFNVALPLVFGQNIGTCVTAILSSIGASKNAKRTATLHLLFNLVGTVVFLAVLYGANAIFRFSFWTDTMNRSSIANLHLVFNVACTMLLLPFNRVLVWLAEKVVKGDAVDQTQSILEERFVLSSPSLALAKAGEAVATMGEIAQKNLKRAVRLLAEFDQTRFDRLQSAEDELDSLESAVDNYLIRLSERPLSAEENARVSELFHTLSDFERIGDYAVNLSEKAQAMHQKNVTLSREASSQLFHMTAAANEIVALTVESYTTRDAALARRVEPLEQVIDELEEVLRTSHVERLRHGNCTFELGEYFIEMVIALERIADHCSNVAVRVVRHASPRDALINRSEHEYLTKLHKSGEKEFESDFKLYSEKYLAHVTKNVPENQG